MSRDWTTSSLGERIEYICQLRGWSLNKLGDEAGIASGPMSKLSRREETVAASPETLARIADAAAVSVLWLMLGRGPVENTPTRRGMLRTHPDWPTALEEARKRQRGIPDEFWNMAGEVVINVPLDWQLIVGLVREFYSAAQRWVDTSETSDAARSTPRRTPRK